MVIARLLHETPILGAGERIGEVAERLQLLPIALEPVKELLDFHRRHRSNRKRASVASPLRT